jgi:Zn-dependent protease with chaperone function
MFVAEQILTELDEPELSAAIAHECGHISTHDNLKRIAMRICGDLLVFPLGKTLDRVWADSAESAADEYAADRGGRRSAINLASALIKVGRITPREKAWAMPIGAFLLDAEDGSLAERIDRLLQIADKAETTDAVAFSRSSNAIWLVPAMASLFILPLALNSDLLSAVHSLSEALLSALQ